MTSASRAHRRFLGVLAAGKDTWDCLPQQQLQLQSHLKPLVLQHLATAGVPRGGSLLGQRCGTTLLVTHLLPAFPPGCTGIRDPMALNPDYLLGALDGLRQSNPATDWIGTWYMTADGQPTTELTDLLLWQRARRLALVGPCNALVTVGLGEEGGSEFHAYVEKAGEMSGVPVEWVTQGEA